ncbi:serine-rich adhesin for platelets-like [Topomyia yanbarensis]|uniref:serine-rich adhesin for platelets-like n=1 Tax=Topomyia yanbarensis TaxID=2498891 RepID=UPI00273B7AFE|nr:serine-rich adhesin for platelets-like [Topomyia yanbarensis]
MSTDSESHSITEKGSRNSATYSIHSLENSPIRRSAVQIIRERSTDLIQTGSPRKKGTMQITKLVLKDHPTSPRRKITPMVIKSITTFTSSALTSGCGSNENAQTLAENKNDDQNTYTIRPLPEATQLIRQFEIQKNERNQASGDFQNYLTETLNSGINMNGIAISKVTESSANSDQNLDEKITDSIAASSSTNEKKLCNNSTSTSISNTKEKFSKKVASETLDEIQSKPSVMKRLPPRPNSKDSKTCAPEQKKGKSYDPQKAREFIEKQQAKRKQETKATITNVEEKDLIKKRLEELRKNSQVLVSKNVQKVRKRSLSATPVSCASNQKSTAPSQKVIDARKLPPEKPIRKSSSISSLRAPPSLAQSLKSGESRKSSRRRSSLLKADLSEKIGIMRKSDEVALEDVLLRPLRIRTPEKQKVLTPEKPPKSPVNESLHERSISVVEKELKLDVPSVTLVPDSTLKQQKLIDVKKEVKTVPPWLKHTLLQPDPYPFIIAVRKKLEAIRRLNRDQTILPEESIIGKDSGEISRRFKTANNQKCHEYLESLKTVPYISKPSTGSEPNISSVSFHPSESNTISEISSIRSDFILPLPPLSSTKIDVTELKSAKEITGQEFDAISPLSVERISNLKITTDNFQVDGSVNFHRGTDMPDADLIPDRLSFIAQNVQTDLHQSQLSANDSEKQHKFLRNSSEKREKDSKELDSQKMLEAFNRSLAQVIEVNQQLYSALNRPPEPSTPIPPERIKIRDEMTQTTPILLTTNASATSNYSEDFERSEPQKTDDKSSSLSESTQEKIPIDGASSGASAPATTTTTADSSSEQSPSKTESSNSHPSLESRSLSFSDSHNTNPPLPDEYLPSFEESLRQRTVEDNPSDERHVPHPDTSSIETQISDEDLKLKQSLRQEVDESQSLESITIKISEQSDIPNKLSINEMLKSSEVEIIKAPSDSSTSSTVEALSGKDTTLNDTTISSDILAMFNRTDLEVSILSTTISETNLSYSSIGLYDQLIRNEKSKGEQLATRARLKEKALLDRTKGQLAWLELQKQRYRERGMMEQISAVKKKQRAILVRLEKDRAELNKFKQSTVDLSTRNRIHSPTTPKSVEKLSSLSSKSNSFSLRKSARCDRNDISSSLLAALQQQQQRKVTTMMATSLSTNSQLQLTAVRGVELEPNESLEDILTRREQELNKRRQHVQALLQWHQKLDREEQEILEIESNLRQYNRTKISESTATSEQAFGRIRSIEQSLHTLQQITGNGDGSDEEEHVSANGSKLNRLWYRLTGIKEMRYEFGKSYTLTRANLESLYEEAKLKVLASFKSENGIGNILLEQSFSGAINSSRSEDKEISVAYEGDNKESNALSQELHGTVATSDASSFRTSINSVTGKEANGKISEPENDVEEQIEERSSLLDVDEIISRVSDITENINGFLSSTTNIDEILRNAQEIHGSESVEFHTIDEQNSEKREKTSEGYSSTFDAPLKEEFTRDITTAEESQIMIEDISLPPLSDSLLDASEKVTTDNPTEESLEEASLTTSPVSTPTPAEETETDHRDPECMTHASELEKRLITLQDDLGGLSESLERVSLMRSPEARKDTRQSSSESDPGTSSPIEEDYSTDKDFAVEGSGSDEQPFLNELQALRSAEIPVTVNANEENHRIEIKIRNKNVNEHFPHPSTSTTGAPDSGPANFSYLTPPAHGPSSSSSAPTTLVPNRMPDIINEAEVLRRQQLQIEQEIKQLEQQVVLFREIPNKPPPPYIPPANGSPLALIFPSESRIDELIENRTKDLFIGESTSKILYSENVSNIYEKLVLDMCKELYIDLSQPPTDVSFRTVQHDKRPLAFFNPPDTLGCLQDHIKRKIKRILNEESLLQHQQQQQNLQHCPMPFLVFCGNGAARRKRDQVDEILAQEMFEEESRWTNFDREEIEVKERIVEEVVKMMLSEALLDMETAWREKHGQLVSAHPTLNEEKIE